MRTGAHFNVCSLSHSLTLILSLSLSLILFLSSLDLYCSNSARAGSTLSFGLYLWCELWKQSNKEQSTSETNRKHWGTITRSSDHKSSDEIIKPFVLSGYRWKKIIVTYVCRNNNEWIRSPLDYLSTIITLCLDGLLTHVKDFKWSVRKCYFPYELVFPILAQINARRLNVLLERHW